MVFVIPDISLVKLPHLPKHHYQICCQKGYNLDYRKIAVDGLYFGVLLIDGNSFGIVRRMPLFTTNPQGGFLWRRLQDSLCFCNLSSP